MMKKKLLATWSLWVACIGFSAFAQDVYSIYPRPQLQTAVAGQAAWTREVDVVCEAAIDTATRLRLQQVLEAKNYQTRFVKKPKASHTAIYIGINQSEGRADRKAAALKLDRSVFTKEGKYDRHLLSVRSVKGRALCVILGEHTDATFCGIASLEQMLEQLENGKAACVDLADYADQRYRGLVEGYYGYPYSVSVKKDLMKFMMRYKMNTYLYGAKSDPYHSGFWKQAYPETITASQERLGWLSQDMIRSITEESQRTKVNFIWAIHPGNAFLESGTVVQDIMGKFSMMHDLGVRQFAVFVDDVGIPNSDEMFARNASRLTTLQKSIEAKWNLPSATAQDTVKPLHFVPQIYCTSFAKEESRRKFFTALSHTPAQIVVYTTGYGVWSVPNSEDLNQVKRFLGRDVSWWWNYPCNDNADSRVYPADMYANFADAPAIADDARMPSSLQHGLGIVSNPMQQGEVSKIPLFSVADYAWNASKFDAAKSWEASFSAITSTAYAQALKYLSSYYRHNDSGALNTLLAQYKAGLKAGHPAPSALQAELGKIVSNCAIVEQMAQSHEESDRLMAADLKPWTTKLKYMATTLQALLDLVGERNTTVRQRKLAALSFTPDSLDAKAEFQAYSLEGMGEKPKVAHRAATPAHEHLEIFIRELCTSVFGWKTSKAK